MYRYNGEWRDCNSDVWGGEGFMPQAARQTRASVSNYQTHVRRCTRPIRGVGSAYGDGDGDASGEFATGVGFAMRTCAENLWLELQNWEDWRRSDAR